MEYQNRYEGLDPRAVDVVRRAARRIAKGELYGYTRSDRPDLEQELIIAVRRGEPLLDCRGEPGAFFNRIVRNRLRQLIREQKAQGRDYRRLTGSLDEPVTSPNGSSRGTRGDFYDAADYLRLTSGRLTDVERAELRAAIARVVAGLPAELTVLIEPLEHGVPRNEIATLLGIARSTLYLRLERLEEAFRRAGLNEYLR